MMVVLLCLKFLRSTMFLLLFILSCVSAIVYLMCIEYQRSFGCSGTAGLGDLDLGGMDFSVRMC